MLAAVAVAVSELVPENTNSPVSKVTMRAPKKADNKKAQKLKSDAEPSLDVIEPFEAAVVQSATNGFTPAAPKRVRQKKNYVELTPTPVKRKQASKVGPSKRVRKVAAEIEVEENSVPTAKEVVPHNEPVAAIDEIVGVAGKVKIPPHAVPRAKVSKKTRKADVSDDGTPPAKVKKMATAKKVEAVSDAEVDIIPIPAKGKRNAKNKAGAGDAIKITDSLPNTVAAEQAVSLVSHTIKRSAKPKADTKDAKISKNKRAKPKADAETTEKEDEVPKTKRAKPKPKEAIIEAVLSKSNSDTEESSKVSKSKRTAKAAVASASVKELKEVEPAPKAKSKRVAKTTKVASVAKKVIEPLVTGDDEQIELPMAELAAVVQDTNGIVETAVLKGKDKRVVSSKKPVAADATVDGNTAEPQVKLTDPSSPFTTKITSWNVAGLRALAKKGGFLYLIQEKPDIFCLQVSAP